MRLEYDVPTPFNGLPPLVQGAIFSRFSWPENARAGHSWTFASCARISQINAIQDVRVKRGIAINNSLVVIMNQLAQVALINLPKIEDERGNLSFIEQDTHIPFAIKRTYWIHDVPGGQVRGGHAYKTLNEFVVALSGSFDVVLDDGKERKSWHLNRSYYGLYVPSMIWRSMENFSTNALCLIVASGDYDAGDYVRNYDEFIKSKA